MRAAPRSLEAGSTCSNRLNRIASRDDELVVTGRTAQSGRERIGMFNGRETRPEWRER